MSKVLTILVPAYNVEKYIEQCLNSMLDEKVSREIEVLVVDDGSTDRTSNKATEIAECHMECMQLISKKNGGHGSTINVGIREAHGKYFKVVDGDDWLETENLSEYIQFLKQQDADIVVNDYYRYNQQTEEKECMSFEKVVYLKEEKFATVAKQIDRIPIHAFTIKSSILKEYNIEIDEHSFYVDMEYILYPIPYVQSVIFYNKALYNYRVFTSHQSVNIVNMVKNSEQHMNVLKNMLRYFQKKNMDNEVVGYVVRNLAMMAMMQYKIILAMPINRENYYKLLRYNSYLHEKHITIYKGCFGIKVKSLQIAPSILYYPFAKIVQKQKIL